MHSTVLTAKMDNVSSLENLNTEMAKKVGRFLIRLIHTAFWSECLEEPDQCDIPIVMFAEVEFVLQEKKVHEKARFHTKDECHHIEA